METSTDDDSSNKINNQKKSKTSSKLKQPERRDPQTYSRLLILEFRVRRNGKLTIESSSKSSR